MSNVVITEHVIVVEPFGNISPLSTSWSNISVIIKHAIVVEPFGNIPLLATSWNKIVVPVRSS